MCTVSRRGRPLKLGGITIPHSMGLLGHSDADVLLHAVADACLGAIGKGDIGALFPDSDPGLEGIDSKVIFRSVISILQQEKAEIIWMDMIVIAESPKILPFVNDIKRSIAGLAGISENEDKHQGKDNRGARIYRAPGRDCRSGSRDGTYRR